jgi:excisionase family DNA binding protein
MPATIKDTPANAPTRKRGYSPKEASIALGLSLATINRGIADGSIPSTKFKDRRIISDETIDALVSPAESVA